MCDAGVQIPITGIMIHSPYSAMPPGHVLFTQMAIDLLAIVYVYRKIDKDQNQLSRRTVWWFLVYRQK